MKQNYLPHLLFLLLAYVPLSAQAQCGSIDFDASISRGCAPLGVVFGVSNGPSGATYEWNLGGGFVQGADTVFRAFTVDGQKTISLRVTLSGQSTPCTTITKNNLVEVLPKPTIDLSFSDTISCTGSKSITITDNTSNVVSREWIVNGSKISSSNSSITQSFSFGSHSLSLRVTNNTGCSDLYKNNQAIKIFNDESIEICANMVQQHGRMTASFEPGYMGSQPKPASAQDKKRPVSFAWSFPDANTTSSTIEKPSNIVYTDLSKDSDVKLEITYQGGCTYEAEVEEFITDYLAISDTILCIGEKVEITNLATGNGRRDLNWSFPGGNFEGGTTQKFELSYNSIGFKDVIYSFGYNSAQANGCKSRVRAEDFAEVQGPEARLRANDRNQCSADTILLYSTSFLPNNSGNNIFTWLIYDSDSNLVQGSPVGPQANGDSVNFIFPKDDVYDVVMIVSNSFSGCVDTAIQAEYVRMVRPKAEFTIADSSICANGELELEQATVPSSSPSNPYQWYWEVKHQTVSSERFTSNTQNYTKTLDVPGVYDIQHVATSSRTCADTVFLKDSIIVTGTVAEMTIDNPIGCEGHKTTFRTNITDRYPASATTTYDWNVSPRKGITIADTAASLTDITFDSAGCYQVEVSIFYDGCVTTVSERICIGAIANWGWDQDSLNALCLGQPLTLFDSSFVNARYYKWSIDPPAAGKFVPNDSTGNAKLIFNQGGTHTVSMVLYSDSPNYCSDTLSHDLEIITTEAKFKVDKPLSLCAPQTITFTNQSTNATNYMWDYGEGETSTNGLTEHSYVYTQNNTAGFVPRLVAFKVGGTCTDTFDLTSRVRIIGPEPRYALDTNKGCESQTVRFTNLTSPINSNFYFDYGDGSVPDTNQIRTRKYTYPSNSTADSIAYYPTIVASSFGCDAFYTDTVILYKQPTAGFTLDTNSGCSPLAVTFYDTSQNYFRNYWDFDGDGNADSLNADTVLNIYQSGVFSPTLAVEYRGGCTDTFRIPNGISSLPRPTPQLQLSTHRGCDSLNVQFIANNPNDSFIISYGNGASDTNTVNAQRYGFNAQNAIGDSTTYVVEYFVTNPLGNACTDTLWDTVRVYRNPVAAFTTDTTQGCSPLAVEYYDTSQFATQNSWDFDLDGVDDTLNVDTLTNTYQSGFYSARLAVASAFGCVDTLTRINYIHVEDIPVPDISIVSPSSGCDSHAVTFGFNNLIDSTIMQYGNGQVDTNVGIRSTMLYGFDALNTIGDSTAYGFRYTVINPRIDYCRDTIIDSIGVYRQPVADFSTDTTDGCLPIDITFFNTSTPYTNSGWDFDQDGIYDTTNVDSVPNAYTLDGVYGGRLFVESQNGCTDTTNRDSFIVLENPPVAQLSFSTQAGCDSLDVAFTANNPADSFELQYGQGLIDTNQTQNIRYGYNANNTSGDSTKYGVLYVAYNTTLAYCTDSLFDTISVYRQPEPGFVLDTNFGCEPLDITFADTSLGSDERVWTFLNSQKPDTTLDTVTQQFAQGTYGAKMVVTSPNGCVDSIERADIITVLGSPNIAFKAFPDTACNRGEIQFSDVSTLDTNLHQRIWQFGKSGNDASGSDFGVPKPRVGFSSQDRFDSFLVSLQLIDSNFCSSIDSQYVYTLEQDAPDTTSIVGVSFAPPSQGPDQPISVSWVDTLADNIRAASIIRVQNNDTTEIAIVSTSLGSSIPDWELASPLGQPATYAISIVDSCGKASGYTRLKATYPTLRGSNAGQQSFTLSWTDQQSAFATNQFLILRSRSRTGNYIAVDSVPAGTFTYTDTTLFCDDAYYYAIGARNAFGINYSNVVFGKGAFIPPTGSPRIFSATVLNDSTVQVKWEASTQPGHKQYIVDRFTDDQWQRSFDTLTSTSLIDSNIDAQNSSYGYQVYTEDVCGSNSAVSNLHSTMLLAANNNSSHIMLNWSAYKGWNANYHYEVQYAASGNSFSTLAKLGSDTQFYEDRSPYINSDTVFCYRVLAIRTLPNRSDTSVSNIVCQNLSDTVYFPNAFSPNNDGINDELVIYGEAIQSTNVDADAYDLKIFNRWGELIFQSNDPQDYWDGTKHGKLVPTGKYFIMVTALKNNDETIEYSGTVTVIR